jgi:hypothetical protein
MTGHWLAVISVDGEGRRRIYGPFRSPNKAEAWAKVYGGKVEPMLTPSIDDDRTYAATRSRGR